MASLSPQPAADLAPGERLDREIRELIVRLAQLLGYPRSLGEIYGLLYVSREPLSMDTIRRQLKLSLGSASQGLKALRGLRAVRTVYIPGQRRDYYEAETYIRNLVGGFLRDEISPLLQTGRERIQNLETLLPLLDNDEERDHYGARITQIRNLNSAATKLIPLLNRFLKT